MSISRETMSQFKVNGASLLAPDQDAEMSYEDIDAADAGRDESGIMHRNIVRTKVGSWSFQYANLTGDDYEYMEQIFRNAGAVFSFTRPSTSDTSTTVTTNCYRSKYSISWHDASRDLWRNYKFNIIEC